MLIWIKKNLFLFLFKLKLKVILSLTQSAAHEILLDYSIGVRPVEHVSHYVAEVHVAQALWIVVHNIHFLLTLSK